MRQRHWRRYYDATTITNMLEVSNFKYFKGIQNLY